MEDPVKAEAEPASEEAALDLSALTDKDLRVMVDIAAGKWTNRKAALKFLASDKG